MKRIPATISNKRPFVLFPRIDQAHVDTIIKIQEATGDTRLAGDGMFRFAVVGQNEISPFHSLAILSSRQLPVG